jgi:glycosyltransferase involved in cell wall biosynthesis
MRALIVVPAFDEEVAIGDVVAGLRAVIARDRIAAEIVVVDDGTSDRTGDVAAHAGARMVRHGRNRGIGGAVQTGLRLALDEGFDCAVQVDGDGQHPPDELPKLLARAEKEPQPDLVVGTRYLLPRGAGGGFRSTVMRRVGSWWLGHILRVTSGLRVTDPTSGYRLYARRALELFARDYPVDYPEPEALAMASLAHLRIVEVPVMMRPRQGGASSIAGLRVPYYMIKVTLALVGHLRDRQARA